MISKQEFLEHFNKYCSLIDAKVNEDKTNFYYESLKHANVPALRKAFYFFACKGFMATVEELMRECGINPPKSRKEQEEIEKRNTEVKPAPKTEIQPSYITDYNVELVYIYKSYELTKQAADADIDKQINDTLTQNNWNILYIIKECEALEVVAERRLNQVKHVYMRHVLAFRKK